MPRRTLSIELEHVDGSPAAGACIRVGVVSSVDHQPVSDGAPDGSTILPVVLETDADGRAEVSLWPSGDLTRRSYYAARITLADGTAAAAVVFAMPDEDASLPAALVATPAGRGSPFLIVNRPVA